MDQATFIRIDTASPAWKRAIKDCQKRRPRVFCVSPQLRLYRVPSQSEKGLDHIVRFAVRAGQIFADCNCRARVLCYHIPAAAAVQTGIAGMRKAVAA